MRHAVVLGAVLLASPIIGQEEPLPPVALRVQPQQPPVTVALAVEPVRELPTVTLEDAARANDYATFHSLYEQAPSPAYAPLHELWTYSVNDPIGAFYGPEMYERFAAVYPGFAAYIDDHKIVDDRGNVFYPTSETRAFLLARAVEGRVVSPEPLPQLARTEKSRRSGSSPAPRVRLKKADAGGATAAPAVAAPAPEAGAAPPVVVASAPEAVAALPVRAPAPAVVEDPAPVFTTPSAPIMAASVVPTLPMAQPAKNNLAGRGILLIVVGLAGIGFLALILRTPREHPAPPASPAGDLGKAPH